jgi:ankyrin repeat protein
MSSEKVNKYREYSMNLTSRPSLFIKAMLTSTSQRIDKKKTILVALKKYKHIPETYNKMIYYTVKHGSDDLFKAIVKSDDSFLNRVSSAYIDNPQQYNGAQRKTCSPLEMACYFDKKDIFNTIYTHKKTDMAEQLQFSGNLINLLCTNQNNKAMLTKYVINKKIQYSKLKSKFDQNGYNFIHICCRNGDQKTLEFLMEKLNVNKKELDVATHNKHKETGFTLACKHGHLNMVKYLVQHKIKNTANHNKMTGLELAIQHKKYDIVTYLLSTDAYSMKLSHSPLKLAIESNDIKIIEQLLKSGYTIQLNDESMNCKIACATPDVFNLLQAKFPSLVQSCTSLPFLLHCMCHQNIALMKVLLNLSLITLNFPKPFGRLFKPRPDTIKQIKKISRALRDIRLNDPKHKTIVLYIIAATYYYTPKINRKLLIEALNEFLSHNEIQYKGKNSLNTYFIEITIRKTDPNEQDQVAEAVYASRIYTHLSACIDIINEIQKHKMDVLSVNIDSMINRLSIIRYIAERDYPYLPSVLRLSIDQAYQTYSKYKMLTQSSVSIISKERSSLLQKMTQRLDLYIKFLKDTLELTVENGKVTPIKKPTAHTAESAKVNGKKRSHSETQSTQDKNTPINVTSSSATSSSRKKIKIETSVALSM